MKRPNLVRLELEDLPESCSHIEPYIERLEAGIAAKWNPPETAPKDGTPIIANMGWAWPVMAAWDEHYPGWAYTTLKACPMEDGATNYYWEQDSEGSAELRGWMPVPRISTEAPNYNSTTRRKTA